jgi:autotransporter-associated beta strand protein
VGANVALTGINSYTGVTTIDSGSSLTLGGTLSGSGASAYAVGGTLNATATTSIGSISGSGSIAISSTKSLTVGSGTFSGGISGTGTLVTTGTLSLSGTNTISNTSVTSGTLSGLASSIQGAVLVGSGATVNFAVANDISTSVANISGSGGLVVSGAGASPVLTGSNSYTGSTTINSGTSLTLGGVLSGSSSSAYSVAGTLNAIASTTIGSVSGAGSIAISSTKSLTIGGGSFSGGISGAGTLVSTGALTLTGTNTIANTSITNGTLSAIASSIQGSVVISSGASLNFTTSSDTSISSANISGAGNVIVSGSGANPRLIGTNIYSGSTIINSGSSLTLGGTSSGSASSTYAVAGTLNTAENNTIGSISGAGSIAILGANRLTVGGGSFSGAISGPGTLISVGTLNLTGTNTISNTNVTSGTLSGIASSIQGAVAISSGAALNFATVNDTSTSVANISGAGAVTISGAGANPILTGINTYSGSTTINSGSSVTLGGVSSGSSSSTYAVGGSLNATASTTIGSITGAGTIAISSTKSLTVGGGNFSGTISGAGTLVSTANLNLTGSNTVSNTSVTSGTLSGIASSIQGSVAISSGAALNFATASDTSTSLANISGAGSVIVSGLGANPTLTGTNSYTGTTTINSGTSLTLGGSSAGSSSSAYAVEGTLNVNENNSLALVTGTGSIAIASGKTMTIGGSTDGTFSGSVSGGNLTKNGANTQTLTGLNTYNNTTVSGGTLAVAIRSLPANTINLISGTLQFNQKDSGTVSGNISGGGKLVISGGTSVTFNGNNNYSGSTTVQSGASLTLSGTTSGSLSSAYTIGGTLVASGSNSLGSIAGGGNINIADGATLTVGGNDTSTTFTGLIAAPGISGSGNLTKTGVGTLTLTGANSYDNTTVTAGILATAISALPAHTVTLTSGSLSFNQNDSGLFSGDITGSGNVILSGTTSLTLNGTNNYIGTTSIGAGSSLTLSSASSGSASSAYNITGSLTPTVSQTLGSISGAGSIHLPSLVVLSIGNNNSSTTFSGEIDSSGSITKVGSGVLTLTGNNSYTGATTISNGTLRINSGGQLSSSTSTVVSSGAIFEPNTNVTVASLSGSGKTTIGNAVSLTVGNAANQTYSGIIEGAGGTLIKQGSGTLTLTGSNTINNTTINSGTIAGIGSSIQGNISNNSSINFNQPSDTSTSPANIIGTGVVTISGDLANVSLSGSNTYSGVTTVNSGSTVSLIGTSSGSSNSSYSLSGNLLAAANNSLGSIVGSGAITINGGVALSVGLDGTSTTFTGNISSPTNGDLIKAGAGALTLTGTNSYRNTTVSSGVLAVRASSLPANTITLSGGTLNFNQNDTGTFSGNITGSSGSVSIGGSSTNITFSTGTNNYSVPTNIGGGTSLTLASTGSGSNASAYSVSGNLGVGANNSIGSIAGSGTVSINNNSTLSVGSDNTSTTFNGSITGLLGGLTKVGSGTLTLTGNNSFTGATTISAGVLQLSGSGLLSDATAVSITGTLDVQATNTVKSIEGAGIINIGGSKNLTVGDGATQTFSGQITGSGTLIKQGAGYLNLTGSNSISSTTVNAGTLGGLAASIQGSITNNSNIDFNQNSDTSTSGANISGTGSLTVSGSGASVVLSGNNTYSGSTNILSGKTLALSTNTSGSNLSAFSNAGTLNINADNTILSVSGSGNISIASTKTLTAGDNNNQTISGNLIGTGSFNKVGLGTLTLTGPSNTISNTTISAGVLAGAAPSIQGSITNNATLNFNQGTGTSTASISGTGNVLIGGTSATTTLVGTNTYSGNTTISSGNTLLFSTITGASSSSSYIVEGALSVNAASTIGNLGGGSGIINLGAALTVSNSAAGSHNGDISGTGSLNKNGSGLLTLSAIASYTGSTNVSAGELAITNRLSGSNSINITGGTFTLGSSATLSNNAAVTMSGTSALNLNNSVSLVSMSSSSASATTTIATGQTLTINKTSGTETFAGVITGSGSLVKTGSGIFSITNSSNNWSGLAQVSGGTLGAAVNAIPGNVVVSSGAALNFNQSSNIGTYSGSISGAGQVFVSGSGSSITFAGLNTFTGGAQVDAGAMLVSGSMSTSSITLSPNTTFTLAPSGVLSGLPSVAIGVSSQFNVNESTTISRLYIPGSSFGQKVNIASGKTLTLATSSSDNYSQSIDGTGNFIKDGTGIFTLSSTNGYSGSTTVNNGTLSITGALSGTSVLNIQGGTLQLGSSGGILSSPSITIASGAVFDLQNDATLGSFSGSGSVILASGKTLSAGNISGSQTWNGVMSGSGNFTKIGNGTLVLASANSYTGTTTINAGTIEVTHSDSFASSSSIVMGASGNLSIQADLDVTNFSGSGIVNIGTGSTFTTNTSAGTMTYDGVFQGGGDLTKTGVGTLVLSGANTFTGSLNLDAGILRLTNANALSANNVLTIGASGTLDVKNNITIGAFQGSGTIQLGASRVLSAGGALDRTFNGSISGTGGLNKTGSGTLTFADGISNTYTGPTQISAGVLRVEDSDAFSSTNVTINSGGILDVAVDLSFGSLAGSGTMSINAGKTVTTTTSGTITFNGVVSGSGNLTKAGTGTLVLGGSNTFTGDLNVTNGTLELANSTALPTGNTLAIGPSGALNVNGSTTVGNISGSGLINIASGQILTGGGSFNTVFTGTIQGSGQFFKSGSGSLDVTGAAFNIDNEYQVDSGSLIASTSTFSAITNPVIYLNSPEGGTSSIYLQNNTAETWNGQISGVGDFHKSGSGELTINAAQNYVGSLYVDQGNLVVDGDFLNNVVFTEIASGATYRVAADQTIYRPTGLGTIVTTASTTATLSVSENTTFSGTISGNGDLEKTGSGVFYTTGNWTHAGVLSNNVGTINANNKMETTSVVNGATWSGNNTVYDFTNSNGGIHRPGNSIGTQIVLGDYTAGSGSILEIEYDQNGNVDLVAISGSATISQDAKLSLIALPGLNYQAQTKYTFLTATNGISGTFGNVFVNNVGDFLLHPVIVEYGNNSISFVLDGATITLEDGYLLPLMSQLANQMVWEQMDSISDRLFMNIFENIGKNEKCDSKAGKRDKFRPFLIYNHRGGNYEENGANIANDFAINSIFIGMQYNIRNYLSLAIGCDYTGGYIKGKNEEGCISSDSLGLFAYGQSGCLWNFIIDGQFMQNFTTFNSNRRTVLDDFAPARFHGAQTSAQIRLLYDGYCRSLHIIPFTSLRYNYLYTNDYLEGGNSVERNKIKSDSLNLLYSEIGVNISRPCHFSLLSVIPQFGMSYIYQYLNEERFISLATFNSPRYSLYKINGVDHNYGKLNAGCELLMGKSSVIFLNTEYIFSSTQKNAWDARFGFKISF